MAVWSEKRVSSIGFENGKSLNFRCACDGRSSSQNRSISSNERPDTLDPCLKSLRSSHNKTQLPRFPFGCYTNPFKAFDAAQATLTGIELMHMLRKGQLAGGSEQGLTATEQFYALAV